MVARRHVRQGVHVTQLAVLYSKQVGIGQSADAKSAERHDRSRRLVNDEAPGYDIHAGRHADRAAVVRGAFAGADTAFGTVAGLSPWHQVELLFQKSVQVG